LRDSEPTGSQMSGHGDSQELSLRDGEPTGSKMSGHGDSQKQTLRHSEPTGSQMSGHGDSQDQSLRHSKPTGSPMSGHGDSQEQTLRDSEPTGSQMSGHGNSQKRSQSLTPQHADHHGYQKRSSASSNPPQPSVGTAGLHSTSRYYQSQADLTSGRSSRNSNGDSNLCQESTKKCKLKVLNLISVSITCFMFINCYLIAFPL